MSPRPYGEGKDVRLGFRITPELKEELKYYADLKGLSLSEAVEEAILAWIKKTKGTK